MQKPGEFKKDLRLIDGIMLVAGTMIGSGIFIVSADIARNVGSSGYLLLVWLLSGFLTVVAALSYGELTGMFPKAGGQYIFLREAYSPMLAFLYGWTLFLVIQTGTIAAVGVAFAKFTGVFLPSWSEKNILFQQHGFSLSAAQLVSIAVILVLTAINILGVHYGKIIQTFFGSTKILALFGLIAIGLVVSNADAISANFTHLWDAKKTVVENGTVTDRIPLSGWAIMVAIGVSMVGSMFAMDAWNNITFAGEEVVNARKNISLSMGIGTALVAVIYILMNVVYLVNLPLEGTPATDSGEARHIFGQGIQFATEDRVGVAVADSMAGHHAVLIVAGLIMLSTFSCLNGLILSGARVYYKMADDKLFFPQLGKLNKYGVPAAALVLQGVWASLLCLSGTYGNLLDYVVFAVLLFYMFTIAGIFILRKKMPDAERPYRAVGYPVIPLIYLTLVFIICVILLKYKPNYTWPGFIIVGIGVPVYYLFKMRSSKK
ncbi:MAG: amino acid permease [Chitinophagales bacterium]|nr:amino acid permease [Chitinophagales bacterium]